MALHELVYVSHALEEMTTQQLNVLLAQSRRNNERSEITGILVYYQREFLQLLEGEADAVNALFQQIEVDQRHQRVCKLWDGPIDERSYTLWSMAFIDPDSIESMSQAVQPPCFKQGLAHTAKESTGKNLLLQLRDKFLLDQEAST